MKNAPRRDERPRRASRSNPECRRRAPVPPVCDATSRGIVFAPASFVIPAMARVPPVSSRDPFAGVNVARIAAEAKSATARRASLRRRCADRRRRSRWSSPCPRAYQPSSRRWILACVSETLSSESTTSLCGPRPTCVNGARISISLPLERAFVHHARAWRAPAGCRSTRPARPAPRHGIAGGVGGSGDGAGAAGVAAGRRRRERLERCCRW